LDVQGLGGIHGFAPADSNNDLGFFRLRFGPEAVDLRVAAFPAKSFHDRGLLISFEGSDYPVPDKGENDLIGKNKETIRNGGKAFAHEIQDTIPLEISVWGAKYFHPLTSLILKIKNASRIIITPRMDKKERNPARDRLDEFILNRLRYDSLKACS
jgi:hypothetical protein